MSPEGSICFEQFLKKGCLVLGELDYRELNLIKGLDSDEIMYVYNLFNKLLRFRDEGF